MGFPLAKVGSSAKFFGSGMQVISLVHGGFIGQSRVICQVLCGGMQVISALVLGRGPLARVGSSTNFLCSGMQVISPLVLGGPLIKVGLSAKFWVVVFKASLLWYLG